MDKKSREIFYGVVIVATLIVAIIGASLAYFTYYTESDDNTIKAHAPVVDIVYNDSDQVTVQADKLIPSSLDVVKKVYEKFIADNGTDSSTTNACIDTEGRQVCSVYRFSIKSEAMTTTYALLNNEYNGFTYLAYAVKDVTKDEWLTMLPNENADNQFVKMSKCSNDNDSYSDDCHYMNGARKIYNTYPQANNSIFGYDENNKPQSQSINTTEHVYDLIIFIYENNQAQNVDQGMNYLGTINVQVTNDIEAFIAGTSD